MPTAPKKKAPKHTSVSAKNKDEKKTVHANESEEKEVRQTTTDISVIIEEDEALLEEDTDITSIYELDDEDPIDMTKMDQKKSRGKWVIGGLVIAILIAAAGYFGYQILQQDFSNQNGEVELSIVVDEKVASGDVVTIEVEYVNNQRADITSGELEIFYPDGFRFESASVEPIDSSNKVWSIDKVRSGTGGKIRVVGQLVGEKDEEKEFSTLLTYQPENFSQNFQESASQSVLITSSVVQLEIDAPQQVQSGSLFSYDVTFTNNSQVALNDAKVVVQYPEGFDFDDASIDPFRSDNEWRFETLEPGESEDMSITGTLEGKSGKTKEFIFQLGIIELDNTFNIQIEKTTLIVIVNPELEITIDAPETVDPGDDVPITITVKNTSEAEIKNLGIVLQLDDAFTEETNEFEVIEKLSPFEEEQITYTGKLKKNGKSSGEHTLSAHVASAVVEGNEVSFSNKAKASIKVRGDLSIIAQGRYFSDDLTRIGVGPLPPVVNSETTYIVQWNISNGANPLSALSMTTTIPETVLWGTNASAGIVYDSATRQVSYTADSVQANTETALQFEVTVVPTNDDLNKLLVLTGETIVEAHDDVTDEPVSEILNRITSDLPGDEGAKGKGVVEGS